MPHHSFADAPTPTLSEHAAAIRRANAVRRQSVTRFPKPYLDRCHRALAVAAD